MSALACLGQSPVFIRIGARYSSVSEPVTELAMWVSGAGRGRRWGRAGRARGRQLGPGGGSARSAVGSRAERRRDGCRAGSGGGRAGPGGRLRKRERRSARAHREERIAGPVDGGERGRG